MKAETDKKLTASLAGIAGEYFVAAELTRRNYIASNCCDWSSTQSRSEDESNEVFVRTTLPHPPSLKLWRGRPFPLPLGEGKFPSGGLMRRRVAAFCWLDANALIFRSSRAWKIMDDFSHGCTVGYYRALLRSWLSAFGGDMPSARNPPERFRRKLAMRLLTKRWACARLNHIRIPKNKMPARRPAEQSPVAYDRFAYAALRCRSCSSSKSAASSS
jgi:hypothetical protein